MQTSANQANNPAKAGRCTKSSDPRKHHYVPVFYQKNFTNDNDLLWVYDRRLGTYKELHPLAVCYEKDLYAVKPEDRPLDMQVETKILRTVDTVGAKGVRAFQIGKPNKEAEKAVALLMAFQWARVPTQSRDIRLTYATLVEELMRISFANIERAKALMERYARDTDKEVTVTPESMVEAIQGKHLKFQATEVPFLRNMIEQSVSLADLLTHLDWEVLVAREKTKRLALYSAIALS
jgi:Protein of unknown function (DUF4238)